MTYKLLSDKKALGNQAQVNTTKLTGHLHQAVLTQRSTVFQDPTHPKRIIRILNLQLQPPTHTHTHTLDVTSNDHIGSKASKHPMLWVMEVQGFKL